jgi:response regulator RpfG family c-di-GMP phosphodiesterase
VIDVGPRDKPKILIVDDEQIVLESLADFLRKDFHVFATDMLDEALALLKGKDIAVLITDQRMPDFTGAHLLEISSRISPNTVRMLITAYADINAVAQAVNDGHLYHYFAKPWDPAPFLAVVRRGAARFAENEDHRRLLRDLTLVDEKKRPSAEAIPPNDDEVAQLQHDNRVLQEALDTLKHTHWHLRKLQEVLPICAVCGKVKSAEAKWEDVLTYLRGNADFLSHGLCPDCARHAKEEFDNEFGKDST